MGQGLELPQLSPATVEKLSSIFSRRWSHGNPVDNGGDPFDYAALWALLEDDKVDAAVVIGAAGTARNMAGWVAIPDSMGDIVEEWIDTSEAGELVDVERMFGVMRELQKPVLFCNLAIPTQKKGDLYAELERRHDIPFQTPERAARALRHLVEYSEYLGVAGGRG
jgi:acyl-CoA synthetase (NDP forming)